MNGCSAAPAADDPIEANAGRSGRRTSIATSAQLIALPSYPSLLTISIYLFTIIDFLARVFHLKATLGAL